MSSTAAPIVDVTRSSRTPSDLELVEGFLANRDQAAFAALYRRHGALILGVCHRVLSNRDDAEDVLQATFLVLIRDLHRLRDRSSLSSWLYGIAHRLSLRVVRARQTRQEVALSEANVEDHQTFESLSRRHELKTLDDELSALPEKLRQVLVLRYLTEKSTADVANELGLTVGAVDGLMKRAKQRLRQRLLRKGISIGAVFAAIPLARQTAVDAFGNENFDRILERLNTADHAPDVPKVDLTPNRAAELAAKEIATMATTTKSVIATGLLAGGVAVGLFTTSLLVPSGSGDLNAAGITTTLSIDRAIRNDIEASIATADLIANVSASETKAQPTKSDEQPSQELSHLEQLRKWGYNPRNHREHEIMKALDRAGIVNFDDIPLKDALKFLESEFSTRILIDQKALAEESISTDANVSLQVEGHELSNILDLLLEPLQLDYVIKNGMLTVTTRTEADLLEEVRIYDTSRLEDVQFKDLSQMINELFQDKIEQKDGKKRIISYGGRRLIVRSSRRFHDSIVNLLNQLEAIEDQ